jgi:RHH-type rel operon transcriptional repressor/antitoxin RelB
MSPRGIAMTVPLSIRLPEHLAAALDEVAASAERSRSFVVQKAIEAYLADQADLQVALDRLKDPTDAVISLDAVRAELGL